MASPFVSLHIRAHRKCLATARLWALVRLLASVAMAVNAQTAWSREGLVASGANVAILGLRKRRLAGSADVMMVLPWVGAVGRWIGNRNRKWHVLGLEA